MAIRNVKDAIIKDLLTIQTQNGYQNDIKNVYAVIQPHNAINPIEMPAIACALIEAKYVPYLEDLHSFELNYGLIVYTEHPNDLEHIGEAEQQLTSIYEDIVKLFNSAKCNTFLLDEVRSIEVMDFYPNVGETYSFAGITLKIDYNN
ncbi:MAG: hypothetical protein AB1695_12475 [Stygiobacter sp.]